MRKIFFLFLGCISVISLQAQTYTSGLTSTGSGGTTNVRLGGANPLLVNTTVDLGTFTFGFKTTTFPSLLTILNNGRIGVGLSPTSLFHLKAGTATLNTAPLKFTSGVNLTTPEAGAVEYDGTNLFFTPSTIRKTIAFNDLSNITGAIAVANGGTGQTSLSAGDIIYGSAANTFSKVTIGTTGKVLTVVGGFPAWATPAAGSAGTVTSVGLTMPSGFAVSPASITTTGNFAVTTVLNGLLRANGTGFTTGLANLASEVTGTLSLANGGTGQSSFIAGYLKSNGTALSTSSTIAGVDVSGNITGNAANVTGTVAVTNGGTGQTAFTTGYLRSNGTTISSSSTIAGVDVSGNITGNAANVTGTVAVSNGGTGQTAFTTGYLRSDGTTISSSSTIAGTDISGSITGNAGNVTGTIAVSNGGTGLNTVGANGTVLTVSGGLPAWQAPAAVVPGWALAGNASTVPGTNFIGTTDTQRLVFKTNNIEQATILSNGNMGIGNTNPLVILDVKALIGLGNNLTTGGGSLLFGSANGALGNPGAYISGEKTGILGNRMDFYARDAAGVLMKNIMSVTGEGAGMVGIGTPTPEQKIDIKGTAQIQRIADATSVATLQNSNDLQLQSAYWNGTASIKNNWKISSVQTGTSANNSDFTIKQDDGITRFKLGYNGWHLYNLYGGEAMNYNSTTDRINTLAALWTNTIYNAGQVGTTSVGGLNWNTSKIIFDNPYVISYQATGDDGTTNYTAHKFTVASPMTAPNAILASWDNGGTPLFSISKTGALMPNNSAGTAGQVLTSAGAGAAPTWASGGSSTSWSLTGNTGTTASNFLGTTDAQPLYFRHNNIASGIINSSNKTTSFGYSTLPSNIGQYNSAFGDRAMNANTIGYNNTAIGGLALYHNISGYDNTSLGVASLFTNTSGLGNSAFGRDALRANTTGNYNMGIGQQALTSNTTGISNVAVGRQTLYSNTTGNYNVGFGNAAGYGYPGSNSNTFYISDSTYHMNYKLDSAAGTAPSVIGKDANGYWHTYQAQGAAFSGWGITGNAGTDSATNFIGTTDNQRLVFKTNNVERASIFSNGSVGIGTVNTSDTTYKLFVEKGIRTRKVKVDVTAWPDYVFKPAYLLPSLNDLEIFLKENQHLPDIPSAVEVEKNGIDLGTNQTILLKKVEELTLYMIELNKKVEALAKENEELKKKINPTNQ